MGDVKKILVVDDDPVARAVVKRFLEQSSYQVEIMDDSQLALEYLVSPAAPHIAVIDWMMPGLSGLELCAKLRQRKLPIQPHVLILTSRKEKADVAMALDSGADDFLVKPFNVLEMRARLRVAERAVVRQLDLYRQIVELNEALAARPAQGRPQAIKTSSVREGSIHPQDRSDPEKSGGQSGSGGLGGEEAATEFAGTMVPGPPELPLSVDEVDAILLDTLGEAGLGGAMASDAPALSRREPWIAWTGAILMRANIWLDQMIEIEESAAVRLFKRVRGAAPKGSEELVGFLNGLNGALSEAIQTALGSKGIEILQTLPEAIDHGDRAEAPPIRPEGSLSRHLMVEDTSFGVILAPHRCPPIPMTSFQLQGFQILADVYPPPHVDVTPLLRPGTVLNDRLVEKLVAFSLAVPDCPPVMIFEPSPLAFSFHPDAMTQAQRKRLKPSGFSRESDPTHVHGSGG